MAVHNRGSEPLIKEEPEDFFTSSNSYAPWHNPSMGTIDTGINPNGMSQQHLAPGQSMPANFASNNSGFTDDDLMFSLNQSSNQHSQHIHAPASHTADFSNGYHTSPHIRNGHPQQLNGYSHTPEGAPIQSPFTHNNFDFGQWQTTQHPSHLSHSMMTTMAGNGMTDTTSPLTSGIHSVPDTARHFSGPHMGRMHDPRGHQRGPSGQWDNSPGSGFSQNLDSPLSTPVVSLVHPQISEVLKTDTPASPHMTASRNGAKSTTTAEMKKAKRRASHNEVERRRRNHINDRIMELAELVPKHRLEDEAVKRSNANNVAMPLGVSGSSISPPATSMLAGSHGRRAASIPQGPTDDRVQGPAKGEVLDGAVGWTRDLLWLVNKMLAREHDMQQTIAQLNGPPPQQRGDDENRMLSETKSAIQHNTIGRKQYSRRNGTDLIVPGYTDGVGQPVAQPGNSSLSPASAFDIDNTATLEENGNASGDQFFNYPFKEEDEAPEDSFRMDMN